jgi:hypothetical protein
MSCHLLRLAAAGAVGSGALRVRRATRSGLRFLASRSICLDLAE